MMAQEKKQLSVLAFEALLQALREGKLRPGAYFSMPDIVEELGFPIAAIREATRHAELQSLLKILPKRGVTVMDAGPQITRHCMDMRATLDKEGARRMLLQERETKLNLLRSSHLDLIRRVEQNAGFLPPAEAISVDLSLHDFLAESLDNPFLRQSYEENRNRIAIIQNSRPFLQDRIVPAMEEHLKIIDALEQGDVAAAEAAIDVHLAQTLRWWGV